MKTIGILLLTGLIIGTTKAQTTSYKFLFGIDRASKEKEYIAVSPTTIYADATGYGFEPGSSVEAVDRGGDPLNGKFITSDKPFYFSVKLPDGNYDVIIQMGDKKGTSATTVRAECRRLMLENIRTGYHGMATKQFTVHVKDSVIRDAQHKEIAKVRLKSREYGYLHWDNKLTLEFCDSLPKIRMIQITPLKRPPLFFWPVTQP